MAAVCGAVLRLGRPALVWLREIPTGVPALPSDVSEVLRCVLETHEATPVHWAIARYMPEPYGDIWARWYSGYDEPMQLSEWSGCLAANDSGELCGGPAAHDGGHGYDLLTDDKRAARLPHPYRPRRFTAVTQQDTLIIS
ncbi:hypothetical protein [Streptomyces sp. NPDC058595]|uniref:hypothetical protein n=1 Tax=Streptomyces sp. NPDC058595 TaxID=3346550 RepID=UPI0036570C83